MSSRAYHILMPFISYDLAGNQLGSGVLDEVWEVGPGTTRAGLYRQVIQQMRDTYPDRIIYPHSFTVELNDL